jgi:hypothetical protein
MENLEFKNSYGSSRNGFYHKSGLYYKGSFICESKEHYLNCTWEVYPYQSVMKTTLRKAIENEILWEKSLRKINRLTKKARETIETESGFIVLLKEKLKCI